MIYGLFTPRSCSQFRITSVSISSIPPVPAIISRISDIVSILSAASKSTASQFPVIAHDDKIFLYVGKILANLKQSFPSLKRMRKKAYTLCVSSDVRCVVSIVYPAMCPFFSRVSILFVKAWREIPTIDAKTTQLNSGVFL